MLFNILFVVIFGSLLHFTFDFSNHYWLVGLFSAVNESTWEHLKLAVIPLALISFWQAIKLKTKPNNFWFSRFVAVYSAPILIPILFYGYTAVLKRNYLILDILTFIIAVIIAEISAFKVSKLPEIPKKYENISKVLILFLIILFMYFTFYPPHNFLFLDPVTDSYGINKI